MSLDEGYPATDSINSICITFYLSYISYIAVHEAYISTYGSIISGLDSIINGYYRINLSLDETYSKFLHLDTGWQLDTSNSNAHLQAHLLAR